MMTNGVGTKKVGEEWTAELKREEDEKIEEEPRGEKEDQERRGQKKSRDKEKRQKSM